MHHFLLLIILIIYLLIAQISQPILSQHCGQPIAHKQKWFVPSVQTIAAHRTIDLDQCLENCCQLPECEAVSFIGFLPGDKKHENADGNTTTTSFPSANCLLFNCGETMTQKGECQVVNKPPAKEGIVSVQILRKIKKPDSPQKENISSSVEPSLPQSSPVYVTNSSNVKSSTKEPNSAANNNKQQPKASNKNKNSEVINTSRTFESMEKDGGQQSVPSFNRLDQEEKGEKSGHRNHQTGDTEPILTEHGSIPHHTLSKSEGNHHDSATTNSVASDNFVLKAAEEVPVWVIGLIIITSIVCFALIVMAVAMYFCFARHRKQLRSVNITHHQKPLPTLHAFNPTTGNT